MTAIHEHISILCDTSAEYLNIYIYEMVEMKSKQNVHERTKDLLVIGLWSVR